jgi:hypothetical protein
MIPIGKQYMDKRLSELEDKLTNNYKNDIMANIKTLNANIVSLIKQTEIIRKIVDKKFAEYKDGEK